MKAINIALFNDTGSYPHVGCKAVSNAHNNQFQNLNIVVLFRHFVGEFSHLQTGNYENSLDSFFCSQLVREVSEVDAVLVNGEGTIHHGAGLHLLTILAGAQVLGKPTYLINSVLQEIPDAYFGVLRKLNDLTVRDLCSYEYLKSKNIHCRLVPDSILMAKFHEGGDREFEGKIVVTDCVANRVDVQQQLDLVREHYGFDAVYFPLEGDSSNSWQASLKKLSGVKLVVTGRHHGLYLALMARKPFVALPSNTWKVEGTLAAVDGQEWLWGSGVDLISMCEKACVSADKFSSIFESDFLKSPQSVLDVLISDFSEGCFAENNRVSEMGLNFQRMANQIVISCGLGNTLHVGSGEGALVASLLRRGVDARGLDVSEVVVARCNQRMAGRFTHGSVLSLPFQDAFFHTVVSTDCMEHLVPEDVPVALKEIYRVAGRYVFLQIATTQDGGNHWHLTVEGREWWEAKCFEAGFRKHPAYYRINDYESLNKDGWQICILLEKIPSIALVDYPLISLNEERGLHMDMTRDTGERSDAHIIRYQWACNYIKPGDRVLDAACGLGYGGHVIRHLTQAAKVVGVDGSDYAIDYARKAFLCSEGRAEYRVGMLPDVLSEYPDGSFDVIISFETLEHVEKPVQLLQEFYRLLTPGGRVVVSVPNDWSDETGEDPNPFHLHVYDWARLKSELSANFILEDAYAQTASQCKVAAKGGVWERHSRSLDQVTLTEHEPVDCEWWLMTAMKSPLVTMKPYEERAFANIAASEHPSTQYADYYDNPWLMHAMVNFGYRLKNSDALVLLSNEVMNTCDMTSSDYAAALCVRAYQVLNRVNEGVDEAGAVLSSIQQVINLPVKNPMGLRWKSSLLFVKGKILQALGRLEMAKEAFVECSKVDILDFGIHLATKSTEALYLAGRIAYTLGNREEAKIHWRTGIEYGKVLLSASLKDVLINPDFPNRFNHGDGVREYAVAWDNVARCANGIHLLKVGGDIDFSALDNCQQTEYSNVTSEVIATRETLVERTERLELVSEELRSRTNELVGTREELAERTERLELVSEELRSRTNELVGTREELAERTERLELVSEELRSRTNELVGTREELANSTNVLAQTSVTIKQLQETLSYYNSLPFYRRIFIRNLNLYEKQT